MSDPESVSTDGEKPVPIVRDTTFARFSADKAVISDLGRDVDISFLQVGWRHTQQVDQGDSEEITSNRILTEVACMRIGYPAMLTFAINFLRVGIV